MNPVFNADVVRQPDATPKAAPPPKPARPLAPTPALSPLQGKPVTPTFFNLKLTTIKKSGETDNQDTVPGSSSSGARTRVQRSITEAGGQKRALDGRDGPGAGATAVAKRHKKSAHPESSGETTAALKDGSTPPGSPRDGTDSPAQNASPPSSPRDRTASPKQLIRQARPVKDFKKLGGISPRRPDVPSPPNSPRAVTKDDQPDARRTPAADTSNATTGSMKTAPTASAPVWRSPDQPNSQNDAGLCPSSSSTPARSPEADLVEARRELAGTASARPAPEKAPTWAPGFNSISTPELMAFTFTECDFGQDGELVPAKATPSDTSANSADLTATLIKAELLPKAQAQKAAVASCIAAHGARPSGPDAGSEAQAAGAALDTLRRAQDSLDADLVLCEMALEQEVGSTAVPYLKNIAARVAELRNALETLSTLPKDDDARISARHALTESLDQMDIACGTGLGMLAGEPAQGRPERQPLPLTASTQTLLTDLDELMDKVIGAQ